MERKISAILAGGYRTETDERYRGYADTLFAGPLPVSYHPIFPAWFYYEMTQNKTALVLAMLRRYPKMISQVGYVNISCAGNTGMEIWKHISERCFVEKDNRGFRELTYALGEALGAHEHGIYLIHWGVRGEWPEHIKCAVEKFGWKITQTFIDAYTDAGSEMRRVCEDLLKRT